MFLDRKKILFTITAFLLFILPLIQCTINYPPKGGKRLTQFQATLQRLLTVYPKELRGPFQLAEVFSHEYVLSPFHARRGLTYLGTNHRLRRAVHDMAHGSRPLRVGVIGGSISWGHGASNKGVTDWFSVFSHWLAKALPAANITFINGCVPATPSSFMVVCFSSYMDEEVDLLFHEYILNDSEDLSNPTIAYERLLRKSLELPHRPAVVMMHVPTYGMALPEGDPYYKTFSDTLEDNYGVLAQYYDVPVLSLRNAIFELAEFRDVSGFHWRDVYVMDRVHPNDRGFHIMADLAVYLIQQTILDLLMTPYSANEERLVKEPLIPPMYKDNYPPVASACLYGQPFLDSVVGSFGFDWVDEGTPGKPKLGFVSRKPTSWLFADIDTWRNHTDAAASLPLYVAYLTSYEHMGRAMLSCLYPCTCQSIVIDGHVKSHASQIMMKETYVTMEKTCRIRIVNLNETSSGEHKIKIVGLVVNDITPTGRAFYKLNSKADWGNPFFDTTEITRVTRQSTGPVQAAAGRQRLWRRRGI